MADEKKKLTTAEILAQARAQAGGGGDDSSPAAETPSPEPPASPEAPPAPVAPTATPGSTADILAAARAQAAGGGETTEEKQPSGGGETTEEKQPSAGGEAPKGTSDILAAARAQAAGGGVETKPAGGSAAPQSTADILAAARAQSGKGAAPAAGAPAKKPKAKTAEVPAGELPPVKEMVEAMKTGQKVEERKPAGAHQPTIPTKPPKVAKKEPEQSRRNFLVALVATPFALAWTLFVLLSGLGTLYLARFMMPNVLVEPPSRFKIGPPSDYAFGTVATKWKSQFGIWVVHTEYKGSKIIYALISVCTHLGCTPNWLEGEQKFKCPCHGSGFYITGINFEGPAPRPLERAGISLGADGMLEVDKSVKFQEELGQWNDGASFVEA